MLFRIHRPNNLLKQKSSIFCPYRISDLNIITYIKSAYFSVFFQWPRELSENEFLKTQWILCIDLSGERRFFLK